MPENADGRDAPAATASPARASTHTLVELRGVAKSYQAGQVAVDVLRDVDLTLQRDELVVLHGVSGSGKTTLLNLVGALDVPSAGAVVVDGALISGMSERQRAQFRAAKVGFVFQFYNLLPTLTARENVEAALELLPLTRATMRERAEHYLSALGLGSKTEKFPAQLSGGEQQRVGIARALAKHPALVLADEPTGNLDEHAGAHVLRLLRGLADDGRAIVLVTHEPAAAGIADRVLRLDAGRLVPA